MDTCGNCNGKRNVKIGTKTCPNCLGKGKHFAKDADGNIRFKICDRCGGSGEVALMAPCTVCSGTGTV